MQDDLAMQQVREGDVGKLSVLFDQHHKPLLRFFIHLTGNHEASEDLVQEVFFRVLKYRQSFQPGTSFKAWLYQIARNAHIDQAGKHKLEIVMPENVEFRSAGKLQDESLRLKQDAQLLRRKARQMLEFPLFEKTVRGPDGKNVVVKPGRWSMDTGASLMRTAAKLGSGALKEPSSVVHDQVEEKIELESTSGPLEDEDKESK